MNDNVAETVTVRVDRLDRVLEKVSSIATGEFDAARVPAEGDPTLDPIAALEQCLHMLATDLQEVLRANDAYTVELERAASDAAEKLETIERQQVAIQELSTPIVEIWDDILTLPIVGVVDSRRAMEMTERLLHHIVEKRARCVIIDITGVEVVDTMTADHFIKMTRAASMLGARCVVSGISPDIAQTLARVGVELGGVETLRTLKDALRRCLRLLQEPA
jgi:rsbT co-antagonist protein RsbR